MRADGVAVFDGRWEPGADDGSTGCRVAGAPLERVWCDSDLVRVGYRESQVLGAPEG